jgi:hypothetical protein
LSCYNQALFPVHEQPPVVCINLVLSEGVNVVLVVDSPCFQALVTDNDGVGVRDNVMVSILPNCKEGG